MTKELKFCPHCGERLYPDRQLQKRQFVKDMERNLRWLGNCGLSYTIKDKSSEIFEAIDSHESKDKD